MATLQDILGGGLPAGLLTPEQEAAAEQRARNAGLLNLSLGLLQASRGAPGQGRPGLGQIIGQAGPVGVQAYQQSFDQTLGNLLRGVQLSQMATGVQRQRAIQEAKSLPTVQEQVQALQKLGAYDEIKNLAEAQKILRQSGVMRQPGEQEMPSPFAPYLSAQSPEVRKLAETYNTGFQRGTIDEETAFKRLETLGKMEDAFVGRQQSAAEREATREQTRAEREMMREQSRAERESVREEKRLEGTESQKLSAGFASRMVSSNAIIDQLEQLQTSGVAKALPTEKTQTAAGVPIFGGYLQRKAMTAEQQQYKQAADNWIRANLRKESGAAIGDQEMQKEYETYFPLPGEDAATVEQKRQARELTTRAMITNAGPVFKPIDITTLPSILSIRQKYKLEGRR